MAWDANVVLLSRIAGTTLSSTQLYCFAEIDAQGHAVLGGTASTATWPIGTFYGLTRTTTTESESIPIAVGGAIRVQAAASTISYGNYIACSSAGLATAPTSDNHAIGVCVGGSSGSAGRILTVQLMGTGPTMSTAASGMP